MKSASAAKLHGTRTQVEHRPIPEGCAPSCTIVCMRFPTSGIVPDRGIKVGIKRRGVTKETLYVWVPPADELVAIEQRQGQAFGTGVVELDDLSEGLIRWRRERPAAEALSPATWEAAPDGLRISIPVISRPSSAHPVRILEGHASIAALLSLQPAPQTVPVLVATEWL